MEKRLVDSEPMTNDMKDAGIKRKRNEKKRKRKKLPS